MYKLLLMVLIFASCTPTKYQVATATITVKKGVPTFHRTSDWQPLNDSIDGKKVFLIRHK